MIYNILDYLYKCDYKLFTQYIPSQTIPMQPQQHAHNSPKPLAIHPSHQPLVYRHPPMSPPPLLNRPSPPPQFHPQNFNAVQPWMVAPKKLEHISCVFPRELGRVGALLIGDTICTMQPELVLGNCVEAILCCNSQANNIYQINKKNNERISSIQYKFINVQDNDSCQICNYLQQTFQFIQKNRSNGKNVLIQCHAGFSRSATILCAYLMRKYGWSLINTINLISRRIMIKYNLSFWKQLEDYQRLLSSRRMNQINNMKVKQNNPVQNKTNQIKTTIKEPKPIQNSVGQFLVLDQKQNKVGEQLKQSINESKLYFERLEQIQKRQIQLFKQLNQSQQKKQRPPSIQHRIKLTQQSGQDCQKQKNQNGVYSFNQPVIAPKLKIHKRHESDIPNPKIFTLQKDVNNCENSINNSNSNGSSLQSSKQNTKNNLISNSIQNSFDKLQENNKQLDGEKPQIKEFNKFQSFAPKNVKKINIGTNKSPDNTQNTTNKSNGNSQITYNTKLENVNNQNNLNRKYSYQRLNDGKGIFNMNKTDRIVQMNYPYRNHASPINYNKIQMNLVNNLCRPKYNAYYQNTQNKH